MAKSHIGPNGPGKCSAEKIACPYISSEDHFPTLKAATEEYEKRLEKAYQGEAMAGARKERFTARETELLDKIAELNQTIVEARKGNNDVALNGANPDLAAKRLQESIDYARERGNTHLATSLGKAKVYPTGSFRVNGKYVSAVQVGASYAAEKQVERDRQALLQNLSRLAREAQASGEDVMGKEFKYKTEAGSFNVSIKPDFDQAAFDALPEGTRKAIMTEAPTLSVDLAREHLSPAKLELITTTSQTADFLQGKKDPEPLGGLSMGKVTREEGESFDDVLAKGSKTAEAYYSELAATDGLGKIRDIKARVAEGKDLMKTAVADYHTNVLIPGRAHGNGVLISAKTTVDKKAAEEHLTSAELELITGTKAVMDKTVAATMLKPEVFKRIFEAPTVTIRVTESKK